jgi:hypothetical protein
MQGEVEASRRACSAAPIGLGLRLAVTHSGALSMDSPRARYAIEVVTPSLRTSMTSFFRVVFGRDTAALPRASTSWGGRP